MFKRILAVLLAVVFVVGVVGCGKKPEPKPAGDEAAATEGEKEGDKKPEAEEPEAEKPAETEKDG